MLSLYIIAQLYAQEAWPKQEAEDDIQITNYKRPDAVEIHWRSGG